MLPASREVFFAESDDSFSLWRIGMVRHGRLSCRSGWLRRPDKVMQRVCFVADHQQVRAPRLDARNGCAPAERPGPGGPKAMKQAKCQAVPTADNFQNRRGSSADPRIASISSIIPDPAPPAGRSLGPDRGPSGWRANPADGSALGHLHFSLSGTRDGRNGQSCRRLRRYSLISC